MNTFFVELQPDTATQTALRFDVDVTSQDDVLEPIEFNLYKKARSQQKSRVRTSVLVETACGHMKQLGESRFALYAMASHVFSAWGFIGTLEAATERPWLIIDIHSHLAGQGPANPQMELNRSHMFSKAYKYCCI